MKKIFATILLLSSAYSVDAQILDSLYINGAEGRLYAEIQKPVNAKSKCPLVIICHGFSGNCHSELLTDISDNLVKDGIASLRFDFNGHGKSDGEFKNMTVPNEIQDLKNVILWAQEQKWVKSISLVGHSQGGVVASMTAGELGDKVVKSLVLMAPAAVLRDDALRGNTMGAMYDPWDMKAEYVQLPFGGLKLGRKYIESAITLPIYETALNYTGPVLVVHGTHDRVVPYTYGERYDHGYKNSSIKLISGEDHGFSKDTTGTALFVSDWLARELQ